MVEYPLVGVRSVNRFNLVAAALVLVATVASAVTVAGLIFRSDAQAVILHGDVVWPAGSRRAPNVVLGNSQGGTASLATFHGRVVVLTFLDSHCGQLCPVEASELGVVDRMLPADDRPEIVVVSVNPRDTPLTVRRFVQRARWTGPWVWMTGARGALQSVWKKFGIEVKQTRTAIDGITVTGVGHSSVIYVVDQEGFERTGYVAPFDARLVASDVLSLEHG